MKISELMEKLGKVQRDCESKIVVLDSCSGNEDEPGLV